MKASISTQRITDEVAEFLVVFLFIAPFVITLATYRIFIGTHESTLYVYLAALVNALVLSKVVRTGEMIGLGKTSENKPLILPTLHKSFVFSLFYVAFLGLESTGHNLLHGRGLFAALDVGFVAEKAELLMRGLVTFFGAIPFFALREVRRILGPDTLRDLFFGTARPPGISPRFSKGKPNIPARTSEK
jgi:hypothetical protein